MNKPEAYIIAALGCVLCLLCGYFAGKDAIYSGGILPQYGDKAAMITELELVNLIESCEVPERMRDE